MLIVLNLNLNPFKSIEEPHTILKYSVNRKKKNSYILHLHTKSSMSIFVV